MDSSGSSRSSAEVSDDAPPASPVDPVEQAAQLPGLLGEHAEVRSLLEDLLDLPQHGVGAARVGERDVRAGQLEQRLDGDDRKRGDEQRPQPGGLRDVLPGPSDVTLVRRDPGRAGVDQCARPVVLEVAVLDDGEGPVG